MLLAVPALLVAALIVACGRTFTIRCSVGGLVHRAGMLNLRRRLLLTVCPLCNHVCLIGRVARVWNASSRRLLLLLILLTDLGAAAGGREKCLNLGIELRLNRRGGLLRGLGIAAKS